MSDSGSLGTRLPPKTVAAIVATLLAGVFVVQNREEGRIEFLWMHLDVGVWLALAVTFLLGAAAGWLLHTRSN
jgi:uncharacterized integral membrane protein